MDDTSKEIIEQLQKQIMEISIRLQAVTANLNKLTGAASGEQYDQFISMQKESKESSGRSSIKGEAIVCLECGRVGRMLTRKHLAQHNLTPDMYRLKWGIKRDTPLMCYELLQSRKDRMFDMKLWERSRSSK